MDIPAYACDSTKTASLFMTQPAIGSALKRSDKAPSLLNESLAVDVQQAVTLLLAEQARLQESPVRKTVYSCTSWI